MRNAYEKRWHAKNDATIRKLPAVQKTEIFETAPSIDGGSLHLKNFFTAVQKCTPVEEDVLFGHHAAAACHMTNQSYYTRQAVTKETAVWFVEDQRLPALEAHSFHAPSLGVRPNIFGPRRNGWPIYCPTDLDRTASGRTALPSQHPSG